MEVNVVVVERKGLDGNKERDRVAEDRERVYQTIANPKGN